MAVSRNYLPGVSRLFYHQTTAERLERILAEGLLVGSERELTDAGGWADEVYGVRPVYLSEACGWLKPACPEQPVLEIDVSGLVLAADLPSLVAEHGAYLDESGDGMWWEDGALPDELVMFADPLTDIVSFGDLLAGAASAAIEVTGTAVSLVSVEPARIRRVLGCELVRS